MREFDKLFKNSVAGSFLLITLLTGCLSPVKKSTPLVHQVQIKNMKFVPAELIVNKGDTVVWTNMDILTHDVTEQKDKAWTSGPIQMAKTWKMEARESADYYCSIHVVMKGRITVKPD
jgi:plastocyanin